MLPADIPKDSSTELTCLERILDICADALGGDLPEHLVIEVPFPATKP